MADSLVKLLFPNQNCHVQSIRLTDSWQQMKASLEAPAPVLRMLGELAAAAALMASGLKFEGALVLQIVGDGPVKLALVEVRSGLKIRATVQMRAGMEVAPNATFKDMVNANGQGRCAAILDLADRRPNEDPYQGVVPLTGNTVAETLEGFMTMSEQLPTRMWLSADENAAGASSCSACPHTEAKRPKARPKIPWKKASVKCRLSRRPSRPRNFSKSNRWNCAGVFSGNSIPTCSMSSRPPSPAVAREKTSRK